MLITSLGCDRAGVGSLLFPEGFVPSRLFQIHAAPWTYPCAIPNHPLKKERTVTTTMMLVGKESKVHNSIAARGGIFKTHRTISYEAGCSSLTGKAKGGRCTKYIASTRYAFYFSLNTKCSFFKSEEPCKNFLVKRDGCCVLP